MDYPKHISEKIRSDLAISYLKHELRKIFPSIDDTEVENIFDNKELTIPRDFWNGLHGVSMGFKLKNIVYLATAENVIWTHKIVNINELQFGVELQQTKVLRPGKVFARELIEYYARELDIQKQQLEFTKQIRGDDSQRESDPIIALSKNEAERPVISVHDGNGRLVRHILEGKDKISAYIGCQDGNVLKNYWIPTQIFIDFLFFVYQAINNNDEVLFGKQIAVLKDIINKSESGRVEFLERALSSNEKYRKPIIASLGL